MSSTCLQQSPKRRPRADKQESTVPLLQVLLPQYFVNSTRQDVPGAWVIFERRVPLNFPQISQTLQMRVRAKSAPLASRSSRGGYRMASDDGQSIQLETNFPAICPDMTPVDTRSAPHLDPSDTTWKRENPRFPGVLKD